MMQQIKFIILISFLLFASNQKSFSQDLSEVNFICEETQSDNKDTFIIDFRPHVFYLREIRCISKYDTTITSEKAFQYWVDTSKCNEYIFTYNFKRSYVSEYIPVTHTVYGKLQYHRKYKTLTFTYYKNNTDKEVGRVYSYTIKNIEKKTK